MNAPGVYCVTDFWYPKLGGMERSIDNLCRSLPDDLRVAVLTGQAGPPGQAPGPFPVVRFAPDREEGYYPQASAWLRQQPPGRIVHVFGFSYFWPDAQARFLRDCAALDGTAVVLKTPTLGDARRSLLTTHAQARPAVARYVALTEAMERELRECGVAPQRIVRLPNGVPTDRYRPAGPGEKEAARRALGLPIDRPLIGFLGRFEKRKRIDVLVAALGLLPPCRRPCLVLAGEPDHTFAAGFEVAPLLGDDVRWLPGRHDVLPVYHALDAYVSASEAEGMSNAGLEALACGLPVLASDIPGHRELVAPGENGLLFAPGDFAALARALSVFEEKRRSGDVQAWGEKSRQRAVRRFDQAGLGRQYARLYRELAAEVR